VGVRLAIVGATGVVGQAMLQTLESRDFPVANLKLLASARSVGERMTFRGASYTVEEATPENLGDCDLALFSAGNPVSEALVPHAVARGCVVIDNSSAFRLKSDVPLVVPEVNAHVLSHHRGIIANPNCSTAQLVVVLHALRTLAPIERVVVSTYQSVSGAGKEAMEELLAQSAAVLAGESPVPQHVRHPIAFNLIPAIDHFLDNGYTKEEMKLTLETRKILDEPAFRLTATAVRVPVLVGHSEAVTVEFAHPVSVESARQTLACADGIVVEDDPVRHIYPRPYEKAGHDPVYVGRIRGDVSHPCGLNFWVVADNLRKGAALNAVQIAEALLTRQLLRVQTSSLT